MSHNLDIAVESYNPAIRDYQIIEAQAVFDPSFFGSHQFQNLDQPGNSGISSRGVNFSNQVGIRDILPSGGTIQFSVGDNYFDLKPPIGSTAADQRGHSPFVNLSLTHPLLRGAGANVTYANIYLAQRDRDISLATFRRRVITVCGDVEEAYHNLVLATTSVRILEQLLADTDATRRRVYDRLPIDADAVSYFQSVSAVESRRAELLRARSTLRTASDRLKGLINDPELDLRSNGLLVPTDRPTSSPVSYNVGEVIDIALRQRTELQEARLQVERADIVVDVTRNDLLPKADVTLSVQSNGGIYENDLANAFGSTINAAHFIDYVAGFKWEVPIGNREAESRYARRQVERRQALTNLINSAPLVRRDV
jgi:outer membrane protein TolC